MKHPFTLKLLTAFFAVTVMTAIVTASVAQVSEVKLSTTDDTSAFNVIKSDDKTIITVKGNGKVGIGKDPVATLDVKGSIVAEGSIEAATFIGDGSTLSNVRSKAASSQGYSEVFLPTNADITKIKTVSITVPSKGVIVVNTTGYADWESTENDAYRMCISDYPNLVGIDLNYAIIGTDLACADSSDQYSPFAISRTYAVSSSGTYSYYLYGENPTWAPDFWSSRVRIRNTNMVAMFFPTGGVGAGKVAANDENVMFPNDSGIIPRRSGSLVAP